MSITLATVSVKEKRCINRDYDKLIGAYYNKKKNIYTNPGIIFALIQINLNRYKKDQIQMEKLKYFRKITGFAVRKY